MRKRTSSKLAGLARAKALLARRLLRALRDDALGKVRMPASARRSARELLLLVMMDRGRARKALAALPVKRPKYIKP